MFRCRYLLLMILLFPVHGAIAAETIPQIDSILNKPAYKHSRWGILAIDAKTGETVYAHNPDMLFAPASVTKLFSCAAALITLGADHRFETPLLRQGEVIEGRLDGDLILVAQGDLTFGGRTGPDGKLAFRNADHTYANWLSTKSELTETDPVGGFKDLARQVKAAGIKEINGDVLIDARLFLFARGSGSGPTFVTPILVNDNILDCVITPGAKVGESGNVRTVPQTKAFEIDVQVKTIEARKRSQIRVERVGPRSLRVHGEIAADSGPLVRIYPVDDPVAFARGLLIETLRAEGIAVKEEPFAPSRKALPEQEQIKKLPRVAVHRSSPLSEALKVTLKVSHNLYASTLPLLVAVKNGKKTLAEGMQLQGKILKELGVDLQAISFEGGAGGGNADRASPRATVQLLQGLSRRSDFSLFKEGLPILGVDGTLADVVGKESPARMKVVGKTGTYGDGDLLNDRILLRAKSLAGLMKTAGGRDLIFAIFVNDVPLPKGIEPAREGKVIGQICEFLYLHDARSPVKPEK